IAGDGRERFALEALARELEIADRVRFLGHVEGERKASLYRSARFLVCPSRSEPFANVILEGLAAGLPVVASAVGGNTELVRDGEHGLLFSSEDDAELAERIARLLGDAALLERLRAAVPAFAERFDWNRVADEYLALYEEVAARGR
ncbi:MAG TPA: glycosyltransferase family 4 protein, partial [Planctomycetota bacterium]|nr:glycosyltransferase family 4 protein [Planctomycetota bacterium]